MAQGFRVTVFPRFCVFAALMLIIVPFPWFLGWMIAALIHEFFHCMALWACGKKVFRIQIDIGGAQIIADQLTDGQTVFCSLAGPMGGGLLVFLSPHFPRLALCALMQTVYNLVPIFPLDGGRALYGLSRMLFSDRISQWICRTVEWVLAAFVMSLSVYAALILHMGMLPIVLAAIYFLRLKKLKIPCK